MIPNLIKTCKIIFLLSFILFSFSALQVWRYGQTKLPANADAAIVLGAAAYHNNPSPVLKERINHAITLYEKGLVKKIIFTGGKGQGAPLSESEVAQKYAIEHQVKESDILIEVDSKITEENIHYAQLIAEEKT
ncbi:YdcF family protein [Bacillus carboniphilus]|uniref:YdcF family protein n=1 Tax=Bacillus carboniphilus TaxID=86663 RepID=A0ABY9JTK6_9BACI|nr:YdcF family protein [Bacillus carboniphilus]WLR42729.1 YdcF family protein [Bacillus carboniphilus]